MALCFDDEKVFLDFVLRKGNGVKGLVDSGISQIPDSFIQPPDQRTSQLITRKIFKPIDLSKLGGPSHDLVVKAIVTATETVGFFQVVNHDVPLKLLDSLIASAYRFFDKPPQEKAMYREEVSPSPLVNYRTSFIGDKDIALEWRDYLSMNYINEEEALQHWPKECREDALNYLSTSGKSARKILEILLQNIGFPRDNTRVDSLICTKVVNMNFYPACPNPDLTVGVKGHSDIAALTILLQDGIGGLQVKLEEDLTSHAMKKGEWIEISPVSGALVVNIGDMLQIISNGQYKSAEHRVRTSQTESRVSIPLFLSPQRMTKISPLPHLVKRDGVCRYREIVYAHYLQNFFQRALAGKKSLDFAKMDYSL